LAGNIVSWSSLDLELRDLERRLAAAMKSRDLETLGGFLALEYVFVGESGETWGRNRAMMEFANPAYRAEDIVIEVENIVPSGEAYVVSGRSKVAARLGDHDLSGMYRFKHTWRRSQGFWQLLEVRTSRRRSAH